MKTVIIEPRLGKSIGDQCEEIIPKACASKAKVILKTNDVLIEVTPDSKAFRDEQRLEMEAKSDAMVEAARPLMEWLCKNTDPHHTVIVACDRVSLVQDIMIRNNSEFIDG
jgi:hypothetical protein